MAIDFGVLSPEINSGRIYAGPGSGPLLAAAAAWDGLAAELHSAAARYALAISGLTAGWRGASASAMATAVAPFAAWLTATATRAEQTAGQARAAAAAFDAAFAATVPPWVVAANRARLAALIASNFFGQNTPAIMATQAEYLEMWAQDVAAMYGYAASAAAASQLTPLNPPPQTTNPAGAGRQAAAVAQAAGFSAQEPTKALPQLMSVVPSSLHSLAGPAAAADPSAPSSLASSLNSILSSLSGPTSPLSLFGVAGVPELLGAQCYLLPQAGVNLTDAASTLSATAPAGSAALLSSPTGAPGWASSAVSAGMGRAGLVGGLSVPQGWAMAAPAVKPVAAVFAETGPAGVSATATTPGQGPLLSNMALSSLAGRAMVNTGDTAARSAGAAANGEASGSVNIFIVPAAPQ